MSARSAVLSLLLGAHPPSLTGREIVGAMDLFGIAETTTRVALTRMVANGDLVRSDSVYTLSARLAQRQKDVEPPERGPWTGGWELAVVTTTGRSATDRVALRAEMARRRVAELREGVWTRPANLRRRWPDSLLAVATCFEAFPYDEPAELAGRLWDLESWSDRGAAYLELLAEAGDEPARFRTMVAAVHHLQTDPLLPSELLPAEWPADALTAAYSEYRRWLAAMRGDTDISTRR
ncbi:PaaX family transcriptional regulator C-terminal domain-containing protein [Tsukamurella sp. 8F]|uniref:PaaX family transcriptional regulator C-terminal domain-containing protein n=1 Tax=unclassified Tsukamurella TaxID=2633480 RepID=UPI0023B92F59|nr:MULTISPECIES: PaaX family transcriptional regulator C-terminal domain-containing protein [unclassified Tsukamurella]MDF0528716.1 PaaX family transcriptional regulator C-terminal domain-containing protein [Tsukamurella sp. 8J]MDF0585678.1 PaaX family transcriptional regulator C-terminal domain-containing protein [Tsukamurella sp. 8F]